MGSAPIAHGAAAPRRARRARLPLAGFIALVLVLAAGGVYLSAGVISGGSDESLPGLPKGPFGTAQDIPVSFGVLAVPYVNRTNGITQRQISSASHGIQNFVPANKVQIEPAVTFTNLTEEPVKYSPAQFRLVVGRGDAPKPGDKRIPPQGGTFEPGALQPSAAIEGRLTFVAPRNRSNLWLEFDDPSRNAPVVIDLGRTGRTPPEVLQQLREHRNHR